MRRGAFAAIVLVAAGLPQTPPAHARVETCQGKPATIIQSEGIVQGTNGDDVIVGGATTKVRAGQGDDTVCVTGGRVEGGPGADSVEMRGTEQADFIQVSNAEHVDIAVGGGPDHVRLVSDSRSGESTGAIDAGDGLDIVSLVAKRIARIDLERGYVDIHGQITVTGFENAVGVARYVAIQGDALANELWAESCTSVMKGGRGDDALRVVDRPSTARPACDRRFQLLHGQRGDDRLVGGGLDDLLDGGPDRDRANGRQGDDDCVAETERNCER